jgi:hypothetical protein
MSDPINPEHYTSHPSGIECIQVTEHMGFNLGNTMKYVWRVSNASDRIWNCPDHIEDLKKALWYINREISRMEAK